MVLIDLMEITITTQIKTLRTNQIQDFLANLTKALIITNSAKTILINLTLLITIHSKKAS